jgi:hypothetical protein
VFGVWGWYDYSVSIPKAEARFQTYTDLKNKRDALEKQKSTGALSSGDEQELTNVNSQLASEFADIPSQPPSYDRAVQFWVYMVGCGVLGTPWALWSLISLRKRRFELTDDNMLITPEGQCALNDVRDIDMSRWMSKSIAVVTLADGQQSLMDDYKYKNVHLIVGAIANGLYPSEWTREAKVVKKKADSTATASDRETENV